MADSANPDKVVEAVSVENIKVVAGGPASYQNLAHANAISHQQAMNAILLTATAKSMELILGTSPAEGGVDIAGLQQLMKGAQTTPPPTA